LYPVVGVNGFFNIRKMSKISLFKGFPAKGQPHICDELIELDDFLNSVKLGTWKTLIEPIRQEQNKDKRSALKRSLTSFRFL
jgi:hypothetical protein